MNFMVNIMNVNNPQQWGFTQSDLQSTLHDMCCVTCHANADHGDEEDHEDESPEEEEEGPDGSYGSYGSGCEAWMNAPAGGPCCPADCPESWKGDGYCDDICNFEDCGFDGGDCGEGEGAPVDDM